MFAQFLEEYILAACFHLIKTIDGILPVQN